MKDKIPLWSTIKLEGYCLYNVSHRKYTKYHKFVSRDPLKFDEGKREKNVAYIPEKRPLYCKKIPSFDCLAHGDANRRCPFFAFCEAERKEV